MLDTRKRVQTTQDECPSETERQYPRGREWLLSIMARVDEITSAADSSDVVQGMLDLMIEITQADSANLFQLDAASDELVITYVRGDIESQYLVGLRLNRQQGLPGISLGSTTTMVIGDLPSDPDWLRAADPANAARKKNVINLPLANKAQTMGVIQIFNFQQAETDLLTILGNRLAYEINRRIEIEAIARSNERLLTLVDAIGEVAGTLDRNHLLRLITENAARIVDAERSSLFLVDPNTNEKLYQVAYQPSDQEAAASKTNQVETSAKIPNSDLHVPTDSGSRTRTSILNAGEFSYFNRYTITAPLRSESLSHPAAKNREQILGGLMVINKPNAYFGQEDAHLIRILANQASTFLQVAELYESSGELFLGVIKSLVTAIDAYDPYTQGHSQRVSDYSVLIARELGLEESMINDLRIGSLLHDVGKIGIPDSILLKPGQLTSEEMDLIREHPRTGINILSQVKLLEPMLPAILEHHERLDGSGYPAKLSGSQISWMGRIVAVADVFDAMTSDRPYRQALSVQDVLAYLNDKAGILFDPACVLALSSVLARSLQVDEFG